MNPETLRTAAILCSAAALACFVAALCLYGAWIARKRPPQTGR
jgi:hypothetical protein